MSTLNYADCARARSEVVMLVHRLKDIRGPGEDEDLNKITEYLNVALKEVERLKEMRK